MRRLIEFMWTMEEKKMETKRDNNKTGVKLKRYNNKKGMEMVQVGILIAIAVGLGLIFKERIGDFVSDIFDGLSSSNF